MQNITPDAQKLAEEGAPQFIQAVQKAAKARHAGRKVVPVLASLEEFEDDPMLLYSCLWYAASQKVSVHFEAGQPTR